MYICEFDTDIRVNMYMHIFCKQSEIMRDASSSSLSFALDGRAHCAHRWDHGVLIPQWEIPGMQRVGQIVSVVLHFLVA